MSKIYPITELQENLETIALHTLTCIACGGSCTAEIEHAWLAAEDLFRQGWRVFYRKGCWGPVCPSCARVPKKLRSTPRYSP